MAMMMTGRVLLVCALCVLWCGAGGGVADGGEEEFVELVVPSSRPNEAQELQRGESRDKGDSEKDEQVDEAKPQKQLQDGGDHQAEGLLLPVEQPVEVQLQSESPRVEETENDTEEEQRRKQEKSSVEHKTRKEPADKSQGGSGKGDVPKENEKQKVKEPISQSREEVVAPGTGTPEAILSQSHQEASRNLVGKNLAENKEIAKENNVKLEEKDKKREPQEQRHLQQQNGKQEALHGSPTGPAATQGSLAPAPTGKLQQTHTSAGSTKQPVEEAPLTETEITSNGTSDPASPSVTARAGDASTSDAEKEEVKVQTNAESSKTAVKEKDDQHEHLTENKKESAKDKNAIRTNATANTDDRDGSTAVSHTTSPLLLLLVVACAAAAAVVAGPT
ncbi:Mucin-associated surface protein (MASP) [Trypanosoma cruzi]|uniref:Mucin-associated surface protein (MASP) n=1 Tax=Trypanosoma cruzi TaxID=5693 RepID=A0A2V2WL07_TRYCR|nr:Mucin-associated surface protein (MASP) [Trypanosoma cruzi]